MARPYAGSVSSGRESTPTSSASQRNRQGSETPPSPDPSTTSDKENIGYSRNSLGRKRKNTSTVISPSVRGSATSNKRQKMSNRRETLPTQASQSQADGRPDKQYYDPDQDEDERRCTKRRMRDNEKKFNVNRADYLKANSDGIRQTLRNADEIFRDVKQTSDATIDSRLLVGVADLSKKKITELALGDSSIGVDVDEFISKCLTFMKKGRDARIERGESPGLVGTQTQTQRRRRARREEEDEDTGEAPDWEYLAQSACFLHNSRPCVSGFLLGPLSVQKRVRQQTQRRAREARANPENALRPLEMREEDVEKLESANLTVICKEIRSLLSQVQTRGEEALQDACEKDETIEDDDVRMQALLRAHGIADDGQVLLFNFCVNPKSFGQTVENFFYVSFLIKEGSVGFNFDSRGLPTLGIADQKSVPQKHETPRNQAVFTLDFDTWRGIVESHGIKESIIPHREEVEYDDGTGEGRTGWYD